jgi:DNA-binding Xre family transcriptional regulator
MAIGVKLDGLLHDRRMTLTELADRVGASGNRKREVLEHAQRG